jgi:hypothetical protein
VPPKRSEGESKEPRSAAEARFFQSPWSDTTQKVRNQLLLVSVAGILMAAAGILPKEITALGLKVTDISQRALLITWALVVTYFTITFALYAYSDFIKGYWGELNKVESQELTIKENATDEISRELAIYRIELLQKLKDVHVVRLLLDVMVPFVSGVTALCWLLWRVFNL